MPRPAWREETGRACRVRGLNCSGLLYMGSFDRFFRLGQNYCRLRMIELGNPGRRGTQARRALGSGQGPARGQVWNPPLQTSAGHLAHRSASRAGGWVDRSVLSSPVASPVGARRTQTAAQSFSDPWGCLLVFSILKSQASAPPSIRPDGRPPRIKSEDGAAPTNHLRLSMFIRG
jgi:hypothetical protein